MINIDPASSKSIYQQIYEEFVKLISKEVLKPNEQLPSVRDLAAMIRINPNTIQKAYKLLEAREFIYSLPGKGNFVADVERVINAEIDFEFEKFKDTSKKLIKLGMSKEILIRAVEEAAEGVS